MKGPATFCIVTVGLTISSDAFTILSSYSATPTFLRTPLHKNKERSKLLFAPSMQNYGNDFQEFRETMATNEDDAEITQVSEIVRDPKPKKVVKGPAHQEGIFSPVVLTLKKVLGEENLNKLRGKVIAMHSDVISSFIETSNTTFGKAVLAKLFELVDRNHDGELQKEELVVAFEILGFAWLKEKQIAGILERADKNQDGAIDFEEFLTDAPRTLKNNLVKLAKKNGGELGFLV